MLGIKRLSFAELVTSLSKVHRRMLFVLCNSVRRNISLGGSGLYTRTLNTANFHSRSP